MTDGATDMEMGLLMEVRTDVKDMSRKLGSICTEIALIKSQCVALETWKRKHDEEKTRKTMAYWSQMVSFASLLVVAIIEAVILWRIT